MQGKLKFLEKWYEDIKALARHRFAYHWLAFIAFIESSIFPLPVDLMVIPMVQANHKSCLLYTSPSPRDQRGSRMPSSA